MAYGGDELLSMLFPDLHNRGAMTTVKKQMVQVGYGKATFPLTSMTIAGFVVEAPFARTLASKKMGQLGRTVRIPVSDFPDIDGWLYSDSIEMPEGTICLIQTSVKQRGSRIRDGSIFVRIREEGAGLLITAKIPHDARCRLHDHNHTVFSGRGDILTPEDLEEEGLEVPKNYISAYMDAEELEECYNIHTIAPAKVTAPKVETHIADSGEVVKLKVDAAPRRMRIRR